MAAPSASIRFWGRGLPACAAALLLAASAAPSLASAAGLPPQPREWLAPPTDLTPPPAAARWTGGWKKGRPLPTAMAGHKAIGSGNWILLIGGVAQREHLGQRDVWVATVRKDGALSPWKKTAPLPEPVAFADAVLHGGRVYVVGGASREGMQILYDHVWSAEVRRDGTVSKWREERALPGPRVYLAAAVCGGRLYVLGGFDGSEYRRDLLHAEIGKDGRLGEWKIASAAYPHPIGKTELACVGGRLVVLGGFWSDSQGTHTSALIMRGAPGPDGDVAEWKAEGGLKIASRSLRYSLAEAAGTTDGNFLYLFGGSDPDSQGVSTAQASWIDPRNGSLTRWQFGPPLPKWKEIGAPQEVRLFQSAAAIAGDHVFVLGGFEFVREATDAVWFMPLAPYREPEWVARFSR